MMRGNPRIYFTACYLFLSLLMFPPLCQGEIQLTINQIDIEQHPKIRLYLTIADEMGRPIKGLRPTHVALQEDSTPLHIQGILPLQEVNEPICVVLALDRSGSMRGRGLSEAKRAAKAFIKEMRGIDRVGLVTFADQVTLHQRPTHDKAVLVSEIDAIKVDGNTALNDAIMKSLQMLRLSGRRCVVALTDGKENKSKLTRAEVIEEAIRLGIPIFAVGLGTNIDLPYLHALVKGSGGQLFRAVTPHVLQDIYQSLARVLIDQYQITAIAKAPLDQGWHLLKVEVSTPKGKGVAQQAYLATLATGTLNATVVRYWQSSSTTILFAVALCFLALILAVAIIFVAVRQAHGERRRRR